MSWLETCGHTEPHRTVRGIAVEPQRRNGQGDAKRGPAPVLRGRYGTTQEYCAAGSTIQADGCASNAREPSVR